MLINWRQPKKKKKRKKSALTIHFLFSLFHRPSSQIFCLQNPKFNFSLCNRFLTRDFLYFPLFILIFLGSSTCSWLCRNVCQKLILMRSYYYSTLFIICVVKEMLHFDVFKRMECNKLVFLSLHSLSLVFFLVLLIYLHFH